MQDHDGSSTRLKRLGYAVAKQLGIALVAFMFVRVIIANPPPASMQQMAPTNEKLCSEAMQMKCRVTVK
jgi:hypothetical protein